MARVIRAYHPEFRPPESEAELAGVYHSLLHDLRVLLLLDNAASREQVLPLLPPRGCAVLVTSRYKFTLPGMPETLSLDVMKPAEARELLLKICPRIGDPAEELARLCGYLPLALRAAGSLLAVKSDLRPSRYLEEIRSERTRLERIGKEGVERDVEASFGLSYSRLPPAMASIFCRLSVFPADFDAAAEEVVCLDEGHRHLSELVRWSLVDYQPSDGDGRYHLHDLGRIFAASRLDARDKAQTEQRHAEIYLSVLSNANALYDQGKENTFKGLELFDIEWENIHAGQSWSEENAKENDAAAAFCSAYPRAGFYLLGLRQHPREAIRWLEPALIAARKLKDRKEEGAHIGRIGRAYAHLGEIRKAISYCELAIEIARESGGRSVEGWALDNMGSAYRKLGEPEKAINYCSEHLKIAREIGDCRGEGTALGNIGQAYAYMGEQRKAIGYYEQHLAISRTRGNRRGERDALGNLGVAFAALGDFQEAIKYYHKTLEISNEMNDKRGKGDVLGNLAAAFVALREPIKAIDCSKLALKNSREIGDRYREANALFNMSLAQECLGKRSEAVKLAKEALAIYEQIESPEAEKVRRKLAEWQGES